MQSVRTGVDSLSRSAATRDVEIRAVIALNAYMQLTLTDDFEVRYTNCASARAGAPCAARTHCNVSGTCS